MKQNIKEHAAIVLFTTALAGCGMIAETNNDENNGATNNAENSTTNNGSTNNGTPDNGSTNNGSTNNGTPDNGSTNNGTPNNGSTNNGTPNNGGTGAGWTKLDLLDGLDGEQHTQFADVRGIYCESPERCIVGTYSSRDEGVVYAASMSGVDEILFDGATMSDEIGATWNQQVLGFAETSLGVVARMNHALYVVRPEGDFMQADSWGYSPVGIHTASENGFGVGNAQLMFASADDGRWRYLYNGALWGADQGPGETTLWSGMWSPTRVPPFPEDWADLKSADPTICDTDASLNIQPKVGDIMYASPDFGLIMYPANHINAEAQTDLAGVCVSTDGGATFRNVAFPDLADEYGPRTIHCEDPDHCWAANGLSFDDGSVYVYYTSNASAGTDMTWERATLPASVSGNRVILSDIDFADDQTGWIVGHMENNPLVLKTTDGGETWEDQSAAVIATLGQKKLLTVFALDTDNLLVGGEDGTLATNGKGGAE